MTDIFWIFLLASFAMAFGWWLGHSLGYRKGFNDARWIIGRKGSPL